MACIFDLLDFIIPIENFLLYFQLLLEIHFENPEKYLIIQDIDDEVVQKLIEFFLVDIHPEDPQQIKLRQIL